MSNATEKTAIANIALRMIGQAVLSDLTDTTDPVAVDMNKFFEKVVEDLLDDDWHFNRKRVLLTSLTKVQKLTVDTAPSTSVWAKGATITGATSSVTCTVIERLSDTVYLVTEPSDDFTDGETLSDGTNSVDCAVGYPDVDATLNYGTWDYGYVVPDDLLNLRGVQDKDFDKLWYPYVREGDTVFTNQTDDLLAYNKWIGEDESATSSDVTLMPNWFHDLISARMAWVMAPNVTQDMRQKQKVELEYNSAYLTAKERNGTEAYQQYEQGNRDWADGPSRELGIVR